LAKWVDGQRASFHALSSEQKSKLESINFSQNESSTFFLLQQQEIRFHESNEDRIMEVELLGAEADAVMRAIDFGDIVPSDKVKKPTSGTPNVTCSQRLEYLWNENFEKLKKFHEFNGHCMVPRRYDRKLKLWVEMQRSAFQHGFLSNDRKIKLDQLDFVWDMPETRRRSTWDEMFQRLKEYKQVFGDTMVPKSFEQDPELGAWTNRNRLCCRNETRRGKLDSIGFEWEAPSLQRSSSDSRRSSGARWGAMLEQLRQYIRVHGDAAVSLKDHPQLSTWSEKQRQKFLSGSLSENRIASLVSAGFKFSVEDDHDEKRWNSMFKKLKRFHEQHGNCHVPLFSSNDPRLGRWVQKNRDSARHGTLCPKRRKQLDSLGFFWSAYEDSWEEQYQKLNKFYTINRHSLVPPIYPEDQSLANWMIHQRQRYNKRLIPTDQIEKLEALAFEWRTIADDMNWAEQYELLRLYHQKHGHTNIKCTKNDPLIKKLARWVKKQRERHLINALSADETAKLDELGFVWYPSKDVRWEQMYNRLKNYCAENRDCNVPRCHFADFSLGEWTMQQRKRYHDNDLLPEKKKKLDELGFIWNVPEESDELTEFQSFDYWASKLKDHCHRHGHCNVTLETGTPEFVHWVEEQRERYINNLMPINEKEQLDLVDFVWCAQRDKEWDIFYERLQIFRSLNGDCLVGLNDVDKALADWVVEQRDRMKRNELNSEQVTRLDILGFTWDVEKDEWWEMEFEALRQYRDKHKHCLVPPIYEENMSLARWVFRQRERNDDNELPESQKRRLDALGFVWKAPHMQKESRFDQTSKPLLNAFDGNHFMDDGYGDKTAGLVNTSDYPAQRSSGECRDNQARLDINQPTRTSESQNVRNSPPLDSHASTRAPKSSDDVNKILEDKMVDQLKANIFSGKDVETSVESQRSEINLDSCSKEADVSTTTTAVSHKKNESLHSCEIKRAAEPGCADEADGQTKPQTNDKRPNCLIGRPAVLYPSGVKKNARNDRACLHGNGKNGAKDVAPSNDEQKLVEKDTLFNTHLQTSTRVPANGAEIELIVSNVATQSDFPPETVEMSQATGKLIEGSSPMRDESASPCLNGMQEGHSGAKKKLIVDLLSDEKMYEKNQQKRRTKQSNQEHVGAEESEGTLHPDVLPLDINRKHNTAFVTYSTERKTSKDDQLVAVAKSLQEDGKGAPIKMKDAGQNLKYLRKEKSANEDGQDSPIARENRSFETKERPRRSTRTNTFVVDKANQSFEDALPELVQTDGKEMEGKTTRDKIIHNSGDNIVTEQRNVVDPMPDKSAQSLPSDSNSGPKRSTRKQIILLESGEVLMEKKRGVNADAYTAKEYAQTGRTNPKANRVLSSGKKPPIEVECINQEMPTKIGVSKRKIVQNESPHSEDRKTRSTYGKAPASIDPEKNDYYTERIKPLAGDEIGCAVNPYDFGKNMEKVSVETGTQKRRSTRRKSNTSDGSNSLEGIKAGIIGHATDSVTKDLCDGPPINDFPQSVEKVNTLAQQSNVVSRKREKNGAHVMHRRSGPSLVNVQTLSTTNSGVSKAPVTPNLIEQAACDKMERLSPPNANATEASSVSIDTPPRKRMKLTAATKSTRMDKKSSSRVYARNKKKLSMSSAILEDPEEVKIAANFQSRLSILLT
jgi:hypothetical protein